MRLQEGVAATVWRMVRMIHVAYDATSADVYTKSSIMALVCNCAWTATRHAFVTIPQDCCLWHSKETEHNQQLPAKWCTCSKASYLVRTWLSTLLPVALSTTLDFVIKGLACPVHEACTAKKVAKQLTTTVCQQCAPMHGCPYLACVDPS